MKLVHCAIGADHRGFTLKNLLVKIGSLGGYRITWHDVGTQSAERTDYPRFARAAVELLIQPQETCSHAVLICGTGAGMSIVTNRTPHIYAAVAWTPDVARRLKEEDNVNCLVIPSDYVTSEQAEAIINSWLAAEFRHGRYAERINQIDI